MNEHAHHHVGGGASLGDRQSIDPVCGMRVGAETPYRYTFEGTEYRFCSERCRERFKAAPMQYANKPASPEALGQGIVTRSITRTSCWIIN